MKKLKNLLLGVMISGMMISLSGCYGSFGLTKKLHSWNGSLGNKFLEEAVFLGLVIIPVYEVSLLIDGIFLNSVEFWTGSNPIALKAGKNEIKYNGKLMTIVMEENSATIYDKDKVEATLDFNEEDHSWYLTNADGTIKLMTIDGNKLTAYSTGGDVIYQRTADINE